MTNSGEVVKDVVLFQDDPDIKHLYEIVLRDAGYEITYQASSRKEADALLEKFREQLETDPEMILPFFLLLDFNLSSGGVKDGRDGIELGSHFLDLFPGLIILSTSVQSYDSPGVIHIGANIFDIVEKLNEINGIS